MVGWSVTPYISRNKDIQKEMEIRAEPPWPGGVHRPQIFGPAPLGRGHAQFFDFFFWVKYRFYAILGHLEQKKNFPPYKKNYTGENT